MPAPIDEHTRAAIIRDIKAGKKSRNQIARDHNVAASTVGRIAEIEGITQPFDRTATENATRARTKDFAARRAILAEQALDIAARMIERATEEHTMIVTTKDDVYRETLDEPPARDVQQFMTAYGISIDKHLALVKHDADQGKDSAVSLLDAVASSLRGAYDTLARQSNVAAPDR